jgi:hypothetical protein
LRRIVFAVPMLAIAVAGCGAVTSSGTIIHNPSVVPVPPITAKPLQESTPHSAAATVGDPLDLTDDNGDSIAVTVVRVVDPAQGADEFSSPDPGKRFVGVQFRITDKAAGGYDDDPDIDVVAIDSLGQQYQSDFQDISAGPALNSGLHLAEGETTLGFETFELPTNAKLAKVEYQLNGGMYGDAGEWTVP